MIHLRTWTTYSVNLTFSNLLLSVHGVGLIQMALTSVRLQSLSVASVLSNTSCHSGKPSTSSTSLPSSYLKRAHRYSVYVLTTNLPIYRHTNMISSELVRYLLPLYRLIESLPWIHRWLRPPHLALVQAPTIVQGIRRRPYNAYQTDRRNIAPCYDRRWCLEWTSVESLGSG